MLVGSYFAVIRSASGQLPGFFKGFRRNDRRIAALNVVLRPFAMIFHLFFWESIRCDALGQQGISGVALVV